MTVAEISLKIMSTQQAKIVRQESQIARYSEEVLKRDDLIRNLKEKLKLAMIRRFARAADSFVDPNAPKQDCLFDEAEFTTPLPEEEEAPEFVEVAAYPKKVVRGKRSPLPEELERVQVIYALSEAELIGPNGEQYIEIGREITEQLDVTPADVKVIQHIRIKYAVKGLEECGVKIAALPTAIIPKSIASAGLLAHVAESKYCHHLPLYRQEQIWKNLDVNLPRNTLCRWMMEVGEKISVLVEYLFAEMKQHPHIHADETPVTVLKDNNQSPDNPSHQGYMWVYSNHLGVVFDYQSSREGKWAEEMLGEFKGYVQTDAYSGYDRLFIGGARISVLCMGHARRKFTDIQKTAGKKVRSAVADHVVNLIAKLYHLESIAKKGRYTIEQIYEMRQEKAKPILLRLHAYLQEQYPQTPPKGLLGKAILYSLSHWEGLIRYLDDGILNIDNNPAERLMKPFAVGRKNWLFCGNTRGARAAANLYSLIQSAKLYDLKIFDYLKYVFEQLPTADTPKKLEQLLPVYAQANLPKVKNLKKNQSE